MSEERLTNNKDQCSQSRRYPRNYDDLQENDIIASGRRYSEADPRLDRVQNGTYRDHRKRSTDDELSDRKVNLPRRTRRTSSSEDHLEKIEKPLKRTSSFRRDITQNDVEKFSARRDSGRSSFESDIQARRTPSRDVISPKRTFDERTRSPFERRSPQRGYSESRERDSLKSIKSNRTNRNEIESHSMRKEQEIRETSRDCETKGGSLQKNTSDDQNRNVVKQNSASSSFSSDNKSFKQIFSKKQSIKKHKDNENSKNLARTISDPQIRQQSAERDQHNDDSVQTTQIQRRPSPKVEEDTSNVKQESQETRRSQPREDTKTVKTDTSKSTGASSKKISSNETINPVEIPKEEWACEHCTFLNKIKDRVCVICCKTRSSALPPTTLDNPQVLPTEHQVTKNESNNVSNPSLDLEKKTKLLKISNSEESGDSSSAKKKGRTRRKISFSFGTKLSK